MLRHKFRYLRRRMAPLPPDRPAKNRIAAGFWRLLHIDTSLFVIESKTTYFSLGSLFFPFFIQMVLRNTLGTVNTITLGHYSDHAVAAVGAASQLIGMFLNFYSVVSAGAGIVISQDLGAERHSEAAQTAQSALVMSFLPSLLIGLIMAAFARPLLSLMQLKGDVLAQAVIYFRIFISFSFLQAVFATFDAVLRSYGMPKISVAVSLFMNILNMLLNIVVVYRPFETPLHGVSGVAVSVVISEAVAVLALGIWFFRLPLGIGLRPPSVRRILTLTGKIMRIGLPGGVSQLSYAVSQVVSTSIIAVLGVEAISAKVYLSNIVFYVYVLGFALGQATSLLIGRYVGAHEFDKAYRLNIQNLRIAVAVNVTVSALLYLAGIPILHLFTSNPAIIHMAYAAMFVDIFVETFRAFNHIEGNALCGAGDVMFQMVFSIISCWSMSILFAYLLGVVCHLGLTGCWIAFAMDEAFRGIIFIMRWRSRRWMKKALV